MDDYERVIYSAKLAEQTERYKEMTYYMKQAAMAKGELNCEERNLLSVGYKNIFGERRSAWRVVNSIMSRETDKEKLRIIKKFQSKIDREMDDLYEEVEDLLQRLLRGVNDANLHSIIFYNRMRGDYLRYKGMYSELSIADKKRARLAYDDAIKASNTLPATSSIKLSVALNYSVLYYEFFGDQKGAIKLAKDAFDAAIDKIDELPDDSYRESAIIMQHLRDNITLWTSDGDDIYANDSA